MDGGIAHGRFFYYLRLAAPSTYRGNSAMGIWAKRIGEGILIGLAAGLILLIFEQFKGAAKTLQNATQSLLAQQQANKNIYDVIATNQKKLRTPQSFKQ